MRYPLSEVTHPGPFNCGHRGGRSFPQDTLQTAREASLECPGELVGRKRQCLLLRNRDPALDLSNLRGKKNM